MNLKKMIPVLVLALSGLATACSNHCKSTCEDSQKCAGASDAEKKVDCGKLCDDLSDLGDASDCSSKMDDAYSCGADEKDICSTTDTSCDAKVKASSDCVGTYCAAHPTDGKCTAVAADYGTTS